MAEKSDRDAQSNSGGDCDQSLPPTEGDIFKFDFIGHFWSAFLNGLVRLEQDEAVIVAVENLTVVQVCSILG